MTDIDKIFKVKAKNKAQSTSFKSDKYNEREQVPRNRIQIQRVGVSARDRGGGRDFRDEVKEGGKERETEKQKQRDRVYSWWGEGVHAECMMSQFF
jgi:hypothetical protein